jgi:hypothetical protein
VDVLIWLTAFQVGRERQMAFCFMQKFVDLRKIGTKVPIITAFALDHIRGFVFVEAEKACDVTEVHNLFLLQQEKKKFIHTERACWLTCSAVLIMLSLLCITYSLHSKL